MTDKEVYQYLQAQSDEIVHHLDLIRAKLPFLKEEVRPFWNSMYASWALFDNHLFNDRAEWREDGE